MRKDREMKLVTAPKFKLPKVRFNGHYFNRRMREIQRSLPKNKV